MATSLLFNINKYILLEYIYSGTTSPIIHSTNDIQFRKVVNGHTNVDTIINDDNSKPITNNIVDNTVVDLDNGRYALLDNDAAFFYPNADPDVTVNSIPIAPPLNVVYDKIRIHILSGYNFEDLEGFIISIYARMTNDKQLRLCNLSFLRSDPKDIFFNPKPLKLAELIYDKFIEFLIPSQAEMLADQEAAPQTTNHLAYHLTNGVYLGNQNTIYCEYKDIREVIEEEGLIYFIPQEEVRFAFSSVDNFDLLTADIQESTEGNYFEYQAKYNGQVIEDFIFSLNSLVNNNYFIIHELRVIEQVGISFTETDNFTSIQTNSYDSIKRFRPILLLTSTAVSFSIEYTIRLYNSVDGKSIFKTASISSIDVNKYGKLTTKINVGDTTQPLKVYNQIQDNQQFDIIDNLVEITKTKILSTFINNNDIRVKSDADLDKSIDGLLIKLNPFDDILKFNLTYLPNPSDPESEKELELGTVSTYYMAFIKNDDSKLYVEEFVSHNFNKQEGEIAFKVTAAQSTEVKSYTNRNFYILSRNPNGIETVIASGKFMLDSEPSL